MDLKTFRHRCRRNLRQSTLALLMGSIFGLLLSSGCSKEKLNDLANSVKEQSNSLVEEGKKLTGDLADAAAEQLPETGKISLRTATPIETSAAVLVIHVVGDGREASVQITSYEPSVDRLKSPSVFIEASSDIESASQLAGQSLSCVVFVEPSVGATISRTPLGKPATITFGSMNPQAGTISATLTPFELIGTDDTALSVAGGEVLALVTGN